MRVPVAVIVETNGVEIPQSSIDRQIPTPIVLVALEGDAFSRLHGSHRVRSAAEQRIETRILEGIWVDCVLCQNRHQPEDKRKLAVIGTGAVKAPGALV